MSTARSTARFAITTALLVALSSAGFAEEEAPAKEPRWTGKVGLGASLSQGTTNTFGGNIAVTGEREWGATLLRLTLDAKYGTTNTKDDHPVTQTNEQALTQYLRHTLTERLYVYGETEESRDTVRKINLRLLATAGPGYRAWIGEEGAYLDLEAGIGYRYEDYNDGNHAAMKQNSRNDVTGRAAFIYKNKLGPADFGQTGEFLLPFNDTSGWLARAETKLSFPVLESWSFENTLGLEYLNAPPANSQKFELDYIVSLVYAF